MSRVIAGSFIGFVAAAAFLAACGSSGSGSNNAVVDTLVQQVADLTQQVNALEQQVDAHAADADAHHMPPVVSEATPWLGLNWCIALQGVYPSRNLELPDDPSTQLSNDPLLGSVSLFAGNFAPRGWALCEGQLLSIAANSALFSILGTTYGGDGISNFALPDLRGRAPVGVGTGAGLDPVALGQAGP